MTENIKRILILGDIHLPFCDWELLEQARAFKEKNKPDKVMSVGDLTDQKSWSRFLKAPEDDSPDSEWNKTLDGAKKLAKIFPEIEILDSNHDRRYLKKAYEAGICKSMIKGLPELFPYKGWHWRLNTNPVVINNTAFMHGDELQGSVIAKAKALGMNVVQGHTHKAELIYNVTFQRQVYGLDVGCMVDRDSMAFDYAARYLTKIWTGFGYIQDDIPYLIPKRK